MSSTVAAQSKRFVTLDGMRSIAATAVILVHASWSIAPYNLRPRFGYLAVDLFFAISGFVLAYSHDRLFAQGMTAVAFMRKRILRLYPLFAIGLALGVGFRAVPAIRDSMNTGGAMTMAEVVRSAAFNLFVLPAPDGAGNHFTFPTDVAVWPLFFGLWFANLGFALLWHRLQGKGLPILIAAAAVCMMAVLAVFHTINVGHDWRTFFGGFARAALSFSIGIALARYHAKRLPHTKVPPWVIFAILGIALFAPIPGEIGPVYEVICAYGVFPALIYWGTGAVERRPGIGAISGSAAYAAYMIHVPLLSVVVFLFPGAAAAPQEIYGLAFVAVIFMLALALTRFVDQPLRSSFTPGAR